MSNLQRLHLDKSLFYALLVLAGLSLLTVYSASAKSWGDAAAHLVRLALGFSVMVLVAQMRPDNIERWSPVLYGIGLLLLIAVLAIGTIGKGAQRWLDLGFLRFQPSEIMKLALPMTLAWLFSRDGLPPRLGRLAIGFALIAVPALLIARQPDLGTAVLVALAGLIIVFLAGLRWQWIAAFVTAIAVALPFLWNLMHDYQKNRVLTLLDPGADPLGRGYHTIQSMIAVGSGGWYGKGYLNSSQAHLEYLPESSTDFIFAVFAEEFGLIGALVLVGLYAFIVARGFVIAYLAQDSYTRLLAGGIAFMFFVSFFINTGMVVGILPVVGVPLPVMSYGGTSAVTVMAAFGILMSIQTHRKIVEV
jgi:rod shape determining protein RodA